MAKGRKAAPDAAAFLRALQHPLKAEIEAVRSIILGVSAAIAEEIKWNAPSFRTEKDFFATINLRSKDRVQVIFHLGAKVRPGLKAFAIDDPNGLMAWRAGGDRARLDQATLMAASKRAAPKMAKRAPAPDPKSVLAELKRSGSASYKDDMFKRYGIVTKAPAYGVTVATLRAMAKRIGKDHALAEALWASGVHDARMLATMIDDPADVTPAQMERWVKDMDNWGTVDTACFH